jgi:hypothetical protein
MMATKETPSLADVLTDLITSQHPKKLARPLSGGLRLAYTPGPCNKAEPGIYRLTMSRRGTWPSENEVRIVQRELREALKRNGRAAETIYVEPWLKGPPVKRPSDRVRYHVLFWRELVQASLL